MKDWTKKSLFWPTIIVAACMSLVLADSVIFGDAAQAQLAADNPPTDCLDDPGLNWRCVVIGRDEPGIASQLFEDNCLQPTLMSPFNINEKGQVLNYVLVGRKIENCRPNPDQESLWNEWQQTR